MNRGEGEENFLQKSFPSLPNAFLYFANGSNTVKMAPPPGFRA